MKGRSRVDLAMAVLSFLVGVAASAWSPTSYIGRVSREPPSHQPPGVAATSTPRCPSADELVDLRTRVTESRRILHDQRASLVSAWGAPWERPPDWQPELEAESIRQLTDGVDTSIRHVDCAFYPCSVVLSGDWVDEGRVESVFGVKPTVDRIFVGGRTFLEVASFTWPPAPFQTDPTWAEALRARAIRHDHPHWNAADLDALAESHEVTR